MNFPFTDMTVLGLLILANGAFGMTEMSLVASKKNRLQALADEDNPKAKIALELANDPNRILGASQIGLTFITLVQGVIAETAFSPIILPLIPDADFLSGYREKISLTIILTIITLVSIIFGEMLPKRAALLYPEKIACFMAPGAKMFIRASGLAISLLSWCTNRLMTLIGLPLVGQDKVSAEDIETMLEAGAQSGLLRSTEKILLDNVWSMDERKVGAFMTPRNDIVFIDIADSKENNWLKIAQNPSARHLVCRGSLDNVLGFGASSQWLTQIIKRENLGPDNLDIDWNKGLQPALGIPNTLNLVETLEAFKKHHTRLALVYNEFGQVEGLVSISDLMSALMGDMPESAEDSLIIQDKKKEEWLIDGITPISDVKRALNLNELPPEASTSQTAGGFVSAVLGKKLGRLPKNFDEFEFADYIFRVVDIDKTQGYRVDQILVEPTQKKNPENKPSGAKP